MPVDANSFYGFYRALVIDTKDPQFMGRVKVRIPDLMVDPVNTGSYCEDGLWAHPANNYLGGRNINDTTEVRCDFTDAQYQGSCLIPPMGSHVFVFFEKGDPNRPYYFASAEYGETIVPPENRVGIDYDKKWTIIKTHDGRAIVVSDDSDDCRVEITGKKRLMNNPPFGDINSVFQIDDNQTVFLIDERSQNEKVFLKDYRGNYIKMIQNEMSQVHGKILNDQLHIYMHDDIHIDTPKNIYITAGENIHIRAGNDIYIHALHDMFIKAKNELKEMAHKIDRYSETSDNRHADTDINDHASNVINRQGVNEINDISIKCVRNAMSMITDVSGGKVSIQSGSMTNISSGGTIMIMGSQTLTQTSMAPESVSPTCKIADMTPDSTPAKPDKERYQEPTDNPTDYPKQYVGNVSDPISFKSKITNETQPYNTVVGGVSVPPYTPPKSRKNIYTENKDKFNSITQKINEMSSNINSIPIEQTANEISFNIYSQTESDLNSKKTNGLYSASNSISISSKPKAKSVSTILKESTESLYDNVRNKNTALNSYISKATEIFGKVYDIIKKQIDNVKEFTDKTILYVKNFFSKVISKINNFIRNLIKKDWKDHIDDENDDTDSQSTISIAKGFFDRFKEAVNSSISLSKLLWSNYIKSGGELDNELSATEDDVINNDLYNELSKESYTKQSALKKISSVLYNGFLNKKESGGGWFSKIKNKVHSCTASLDESFNESKYNQLSTSIISSIKEYSKKIIDKIFSDDIQSYYENEIKKECDNLKVTIDNDSSDIKVDSSQLVYNSLNKLNFDYMANGMTSEFDKLFNDSVSEFSGELKTVNDKYSNSMIITLDNYKLSSVIAVCDEQDDEFSDQLSFLINDYFDYCSDISTNPGFIDEYNQLWENGKIPTVDEITNLTLKYTSEKRNNTIKKVQSDYSDIWSVSTTDENIKQLENIIVGDKDEKVEGTLYGEGIIARDSATESLNQLNSLLTMPEKLDTFAKETYESEALDQVTNIIQDGSNIESDIDTMLKNENIYESLRHLQSIVANESKVDVTEDTSAIGSVLTNITDTIKSPLDYLTNMSPPQPSTVVNEVLNEVPSVDDMASSIGDGINEFINGVDCYSAANEYLSGFNYDNMADNMFSTVQDYCGLGDSGISGFTESLCNAIRSPVDGLSNFISGTSSFLDNIRSKLTLNRNPFDFVYRLANGPSQFVNQLSSNTNSMFNRCKNAIKGMSPLSDVLVTVETLYDTIMKANDCIYNFKNGVLQNLKDIISSPIRLKNDFNSYLQNAVDLINNMETGGDVIDALKENIGFSFSDYLEDLLDPFDDLSGVQDTLNSSIHDVFTDYDPFSEWDNSTESTLDIIKSLFEDEVSDNCYNTIINDDTVQESITEIWETIKDKELEDLTQEDVDKINDKIEDIIEKEQEILEDEDTIKDSVIDKDTGEIKDDIISEIEDNIKDTYPTEDSLTEDVTDKLEDIYNEVIEDQKEVIEDNIILNDNQINDEFSEYNPINKLHSIPNSCGVGYQYLLFMKRKYISTIPVLVSRSGSNFLSFSLIKDIDKIKESTQFKLMDNEVINDYYNIINNYNNNIEVKRNTLWWKNLDFIMKQCEIYSIDLFITIFDFTEKSLFNGNYKTEDWDKVKEKFIKDICDFINYRIDDNGDVVYENNKPQKRYCRCILNFGYGSYSDPDDINNEKYPVYPTCGFLRSMIMYMAYDCLFTSNMMALTADENNNLYYYNPYTEWKSFDDEKDHKLNEFEITAIDYVDGLSNGMAKSVTYDEQSKINGGYCNFLINCNKKSIPIMSMCDFSYIMNELRYTDEDKKISVLDYYTVNGEIHPNIMNDIFNPSSRKCIRYFKKKDYFSTGEYVRFDINGEITE